MMRLKKIGLIVLWICLGSLFLYGMLYAHKKQSSILLQNIFIQIEEEGEFVVKTDVQQWLTSKKIVPHKPLNSIDLAMLEKTLAVNPYVEHVSIHKTMQGDLFIHIKQRRAVFRVFNLWKDAFYVDDNGFKFPTSNQYTPRVLIVCGHIPERVNDNASLITISDNTQDTVPKNLIFKIFQVAQKISKDKFWSKQISMVYVNEYKQFEFVPVLGNQRIIFGDTDRMDEKFENLKALYLKGFPRVGWDTYQHIDLRFNGQIICKKKL